jgi:hypothetical protein
VRFQYTPRVPRLRQKTLLCLVNRLFVRASRRRMGRPSALIRRRFTIIS